MAFGRTSNSGIGPTDPNNYGPNPGVSGGDPRGRLQNQSQYQQQRYESQQGPMVAAFAGNYGRGSEADYGNYTDIMNNYRAIASGGAGAGDGGGGGGGGGYSAPTFSAHTIGYDDPFNSYGGYQDFASTGGYSGADVNNLRARGVSPIRAAYANAQNEMSRQRSLQGGYSPNAAASLVKMAREQGQGAADAVQNVEAGIVNQRNANKLSGLGGMSGIEGQRLGAQIDVNKFNAGQMTDADARNAAAAAAAAASSGASASESMQNRLAALRGMTTLYGTTPAMANTFGNQLLQGVGQGGNFGLSLYGQDINASRAPGAWDTNMSRIGQIGGMVGGVAGTVSDIMGAYNKNKKNQPNTGGGAPTPTNTPPYIPYHYDDPQYGNPYDDGQ